MRELLKQLGFEERQDDKGTRIGVAHPDYENAKTVIYLPTRNEFDEKIFEEVYYKQMTVTNGFYNIQEFKRFQDQPLTKGMFIPCDEEGDVLDYPEPIFDEIELKTQVPYNKQERELHERYLKAKQRFQQALDRVLFDFFSTTTAKKFTQEQRIEYIKHPFGVLQYETIEQAINNGVKLYLTNTNK